MARKKATSETEETKKSTAAKKPAAKKQAARKPATASEETAAPAADERAPATTDRRSRIISEIVSIAEGLEDDSLDLLLEQAKTVNYKNKIEKFNRQLNVAARKAVEARHKAARPDYYVEIEQTEDGFFIIQLDDQRIFFNRAEMRELTRICHKAKDANAGARNLFRWFERERSDLLADAGIDSNRSPYLLNLYEIIVNTYKVKD